MEWGIPQGSIGGPILFVSYTAPVEDIIHAHGLSYVTYANDTIIYFHEVVTKICYNWENWAIHIWHQSLNDQKRSCSQR